MNLHYLPLDHHRPTRHHCVMRGTRALLVGGCLVLAGCGSAAAVSHVTSQPPAQPTTATPASTDPPRPCLIYTTEHLPINPPDGALYVWVPNYQVGSYEVTRDMCEKFGTDVPACVAPTFDQCIKRP